MRAARMDRDDAAREVHQRRPDRGRPAGHVVREDAREAARRRPGREAALHAERDVELPRELHDLVGADRLRHASDRRLGVWSRQDIDAVAQPFADMPLMRCRIQDHFWAGGTVSPPVMHFGQASTLGVMGESNGVPRVNFALADKPFNDDSHFHNQHLVASISFIGGLYGARPGKCG